MDLLIGLLILLLGACIASMGSRIWFWMLPILGFMAGFFLGAIIIANLMGDSVLSTVLGWIVGIVAGIAFALVSWLWWYAGAILAASASGALLASALLATFGVDNRWTLLLASFVGAALLAFIALVLALPIYIVIVNTAIAGAIGVVSGLLLIFDRLSLAELDLGHAVAIINDSLGWWLLWIVVAAVGIVIQLRFPAVIAFPTDRYVPARSAVRYETDREQRAP